MIYQELIFPTATIALSSVLVIDTLMRPKQIYQSWIRSRGINRILRQVKASKGHWIIVAGTEKSGKSTILKDKQKSLRTQVDTADRYSLQPGFFHELYE